MRSLNRSPPDGTSTCIFYAEFGGRRGSLMVDRGRGRPGSLKSVAFSLRGDVFFHAGGFADLFFEADVVEELGLLPVAAEEPDDRQQRPSGLEMLIAHQMPSTPRLV